MKIIITMAGNGSRFRRIGILKPKYKILVNNKSLFEWSMLSLTSFFEEEFIYIVRQEDYDKDFFNEKCKELGIKNFQVVIVSRKTDGQASTAMLADEYIDDSDSCIIYNIDTYVEKNSIKPSHISPEDEGFIPAVVAYGNRWSFIRLDKNQRVIDIAEKEPISNLATIGLYYFKEWKRFKSIYLEEWENIKAIHGEVYIAPLYKDLIKKGMQISAIIIPDSEVNILGTPQEIITIDPNFKDNN